MTAHELARQLLAMPDLPVITENDAIMVEIIAIDDRSESWSSEQGFHNNVPAIVLLDKTAS